MDVEFPSTGNSSDMSVMYSGGYREDEMGDAWVRARRRSVEVMRRGREVGCSMVRGNVRS